MPSVPQPAVLRTFRIPATILPEPWSSLTPGAAMDEHDLLSILHILIEHADASLILFQDGLAQDSLTKTEILCTALEVARAPLGAAAQLLRAWWSASRPPANAPGGAV